MGLAENYTEMKSTAANNFSAILMLVVLLLAASDQTSAQEVLTTAEVTALDGSSGPLGSLSAVKVKLRFTDIETKEPYTENLEPNAWFRVRKPGDQHCSGEIRVAYAQNNVNLTSQLIVTANVDNTLTFVDPLMKLGAANIFSIARLPEQPIDATAFAGEISAPASNRRGDGRQSIRWNTAAVNRACKPCGTCCSRQQHCSCG